jgi:hypothetical protein
MQPTLRVRIPSTIWPQIELALRNLAIWLQADLDVSVEEGASERVSFLAGEDRVELPVPNFAPWEAGQIETICWRGIELPQPKGCDAQIPDLLGLVHYLFNDFEELRQERSSPSQRYQIQRSQLASVYETNYLDRALREVFAPFLHSNRRPCGVILTHDLDILSRRGLRSHPWSPREALHRSVLSLKKGRVRESLFYLASFYELTKVDAGNPSPFEFLDWAEAEAGLGMRSVFFVFAPDRKRTFRDDASYTFSQRNPKKPRVTLRDALAGLLEQGFLVQPHLSRSSDYQAEEIRREFESLSRELGVPVSATRNHWLWIQYSDWYEILSELEVNFDFNQATVGYPKGTAMPYLSTNHRTLVFPTTFMDDAVLKTDRLGCSGEEALGMVSKQLDDLEESGGCIALSFHPAEDSAEETGGRQGKLKLYEQVLAQISQRQIPVYLPEEARKVFDRGISFPAPCDNAED